MSFYSVLPLPPSLPPSGPQLIQILLKKFCVTDNPKKFSLYEEYGSDCKRKLDSYIGQQHPILRVGSNSPPPYLSVTIHSFVTILITGGKI